MSTQEDILAEREKLRTTYGALFDEVTQILFLHDPAGINYVTNHDEYEPEVGTILPRFHHCSHATGAYRIVREEMARWFGGEYDKSRAAAADDDMWHAWQRSTTAPSK